MIEKPGQNLPLALTMGDPAGVGPELTARIWFERREKTVPPFLYIAAAGAFSHLKDAPPTVEVSSPREALDVFDRALPVQYSGSIQTPRPGVENPANAEAIIGSIKDAVRLTMDGETAAIITNPIFKAGLKARGFEYSGHTDFLADILGLQEAEAVMMLAGKGLRVAPLTHHLSLRDAIAQVEADRIVHHARIILGELETLFGIGKPRLAVAGLNPHAGENGAFGDEEIREISPAVDILQKEGFDVTGPFPPDSLFAPHRRASYDAVLCMYHDQALIPLKALDFEDGVNITLGLGMVRTSPVHGTAFGIAGQGIASPSSLRAALRMAARLSGSNQ
ncbi:MAG: 4-hydroxythreonine-4-phosphate dehydrogenase PdxA [Sphingomonadales bacterium]